MYPRSFCDASGDGIGDLRGVITRLDYLQDLGVDAVWLSPFYPSPLADAGYDVSDYCDVNPLFGTLHDFDELVAAAAGRAMRVIVDIVPNHCSVDHELFQRARADGPGSAARSLFHFRRGRGPEGDEPPNNWQSSFGGPAWTRLPDGEWYLHMFDSSQPDWNWDNPAVPALFEKVLRFWLDRGVAGFRIDVGSALFKDPALPDDGPDAVRGEEPSRRHRRELHALYARWREILDEYPTDGFPGARTALPEIYDRADSLPAYFSYAGVPQMLNFSMIQSGWSAATLRHGVDKMLALAADVPGRVPWAVGNHDVIRLASRLGGAATERQDLRPEDTFDCALGTRRARAFALLQFALPGSAYIYQGDELGLPEVTDIAPDKRDDPVFFRTKGDLLGRDGCRVPLPWSGESPPFGFAADGVAAWLPQPSGWEACTAERQQADDDSMLRLYQRAIANRPTGAFRWLDSPADALRFGRDDGFACAVNLGATPIDLPPGQVVLASGATDGVKLPPDTAVWMRTPA